MKQIRHKSFGKNLTKAIKQTGEYTRTIARRAKISEASLSQYKAGLFMPLGPKLKRLAAAVEVSLDELLKD